MGVNPQRTGDGRAPGGPARRRSGAGAGPLPDGRDRGAEPLTAREAAEALWLAAVRADLEGGGAGEQASEPGPPPAPVREPPEEDREPWGGGPPAAVREPPAAEGGRDGAGPPSGPGEGAESPLLGAGLPGTAAGEELSGAGGRRAGPPGPYPPAAPAPPRIAPRRGDQAWLDRALRPFAVPAASPSERALDEEATARNSAAAGRWLPALRPVPERGHRLLLVREESLTMLAHTGDLDAFQRLVGDRGVFRDVRARRCGAPGRARPQDWAELDRALAAADPGALLLLCTDGMSEEWRSGRMHARLARWARRHCTAILNPLPRRQWHRGHIDTYRARLDFPAGAASGLPRNTRLGVHPTDPGELLRSDRPLPSAVPVPVVAFPDGLAEFARFAAGRRLPSGYHARVLPARPGGRPPAAVPEAAVESAEDAVLRFRADASDTAFRLARLLAAVPLSLPAMRGVQSLVLPEADSGHLAEVLCGGLLVRTVPGERAARADEVTLDFRPRVREVLLAHGRRSETLRAMLAWARSVRSAVPWAASVESVLLHPARTALMDAVPEEAIPHARAVHASLRSVSGTYLSLSDRLSEALGPSGAGPRYGDEGNRDRMTIRTDASAPHAEDIKGAGDAEVEEADVRAEPSRVDGEGPALRPAAGDEAPPARDTPRNPAGDPLAAARSVPPSPASRHEPGDPPPVWSPAIPQRNRSFIGRSAELEELAGRLSEGTTSILPEAVWGMGGVGKTHLAVEYVHRHQDEYDLVWWVPSSSTGEMMRSLIDLAETLELPVDSTQDKAVPAVLEALRLGVPYRDWLLVFDNAESPEMVRDFLPTNGTGRILITSRNPDWERTTRALEVSVFSPEESRELIRLRRPDLPDEGADRVAEVLGHLPLAVEQAAVWLLQTGMNADDYLEAFEAENEALLNVPDLTEYGRPVTAAWNLSLRRLEEKNPSALALLRVCAFLAPVPVPRRYFRAARGAQLDPELLSIVNSPVALSAAFRDISQLSLARLDHRAGTLQMHRLVQQTLRQRLEPDERNSVRHQAHLILAAMDPEEPANPAEWPVYSELLPHIRAAEVHTCSEPWVRNLTVNVTAFLNWWGDIQGALNVGRRAMEMWGGEQSETHPQSVALAKEVVEVLRGTGRFAEAQEINSRLCDALMAEHGLMHEDTLALTSALADGKRIEGDYQGAIELSEQVWRSSMQLLGREDPVAIQYAQLHALSLRHGDRVDEALELDREAYALFGQVLGPGHPSSQAAGVSIGIDLFSSGRYLQAEAWLREMNELSGRMFGEGSRQHVGARSLHSVALYRAGMVEEAVEQAQETYQARKVSPGPNAPETWRAGAALAIALREAGLWERALETSEEVLRSYSEAYGDDHPQSLAVKNNHATIHRRVGRTSDALRDGETVLAELERRLGEKHSYTLVARIGVANALAAQGETVAACEADRRTAELARESLGAEHPVTLCAERNFAVGEAEIDGEEPSARLAELRSRYAQALGDGHPNTVSLAQGEREDKDIYPIAL
ncbi:tetratricopeptide repeat protein [Nocardiopsis sp. CNT-189]|uniref:FxSxx-COOH system tetratricopeptide repeat protein n=1 Tax=Nocardiopsis oceanisediminis TaxID=2816862 RepID=UPI003B2E19E9